MEYFWPLRKVKSATKKAEKNHEKVQLLANLQLNSQG
jgi:hypothetical protein